MGKEELGLRRSCAAHVVAAVKEEGDTRVRVKRGKGAPISQLGVLGPRQSKLP